MRRWYLAVCIVLACGWLSPPARSIAHAQTSAGTSAARPGAGPTDAASSGVYYEIFVRSFRDSDGDGIGDLNGITQTLDYLKWLGVSGLWLTPINPSPTYHGYDVTDYFAINPQFGTMADFQHLLDAAHQRGIKVLMDLVINHTSDQNPWFRKAIDPHSPYHDWYVWAGNNAELDRENPWGAKAWHAAPDGQHYLGVFTAQMPDLNYDNPAVRKKMIKIGRFWLKKGVDGFRLDAAKHIYDNFRSDDDNPRTVAKNVRWWTQFRDAMKRVNPHVFLVGEVSASQAVELAPYYAALNSVFNFPLAESLIDSARSEHSADLGGRDRRALADFRQAAGGAVTDTPFLSNHDQNRVANKLDGNEAHMRMAAAMLLTLPGAPFIYYGEEIGMRGAKPDPRIREPMRWDTSMHARGETTWESNFYNTSARVSVAAQRDAPHSLLTFYRTLIHWRAQLPALRDGGITPYPADRGSISAYVRDDGDQRLLVVHNLSGQSAQVKLLRGAFSRIIRRTRDGAAVQGRTLSLPGYTTVILQ